MGLIIRLLVVAGLAVDAYVHIHLVGDVGGLTSGGHLTEGMLFLIQGILAGIIALLVLVWARPGTYAIAFLVAASALGAVLLYRYVDVGALGPLPDMYEPVWYTEKLVTTVAEAVAAVASLAGFWHSQPRRRALAGTA